MFGVDCFEIYSLEKGIVLNTYLQLGLNVALKFTMTCLIHGLHDHFWRIHIRIIQSVTRHICLIIYLKDFINSLQVLCIIPWLHIRNGAQ